MKVLVTGATGQLVQSLVERSQSLPALELVAVGRPDLDLEKPDSIVRAVQAVSPDVVINAAAYTAVDQAEDEPEQAFRINGAAAGELAAAARAAGARIIQISTDYVFDGTAPDAYAETASVNPLGVYGRSKLQGEEAVRAAAPEHVIVRTAWVYSPFGRNFVKTMLALGRDRDALTVVEDQHGNPSSALDLAHGLLAILSRWGRLPEAGLGETYHLAGTGSVSWFEFARHVFDASQRLGGPWAEVRPIHSQDWPTKAVRPKNSRLDCSKYGCDFGYCAPEWRLSASHVVERLVTNAGAEAGG
ncbi:MAG: dTDP-4-dehydrorhamnose reductase [uncultured Chloroflexia bacterium]|uniref:dTDP-4-dehydrorhamnose reductase n=1 Tax=uncultured Chloroflexia bacterium TaxID=1672391 RepID=A0A6J4IRV7_9CHLR|nr:MAG: dTDP-4-dehydrorhamnose reductase [uncultured Chloroflexia bacterium]